MNTILAEHYEEMGGVDVLTVLLILAAVAVAIVVLVVVFRRLANRPAGDSPTRDPQAEATNLRADHDTRILAMVRQQGRPLSQAEIVETQGLSEKDVAESLIRLEEYGLIKRTWDSTRATYLVEPVG